MPDSEAGTNQTSTRRRVEPSAATDATLALVGGTVWKQGHLQAATVVIDDGRIAAIGPSKAPESARVIDLAGATVLPGFVDAHVHVQFATADAILRGGVTTVRDLGSPAEARAEKNVLRVLHAGRILTPLGGYPSRSWGSDGTAREVAGADDAIRAVREQHDAGACVVKVALENSGNRPLFDAQTLATIVTTAHDAGLRVTVHVGTARALRMAIEHGVDELAHLPLHDVTPEEMQQAAGGGMTLVPTLEIRGHDPHAARAVAAFREAGGVVIYGTDLGNGGTTPGIEVTEIRAMLKTGMTPAEVLDSATAGAADYLGLDGLGRIEAGATADVIAVDGDPLADVDAYDRVRLVIAGGEIFLHR